VVEDSVVSAAERLIRSMPETWSRRTDFVKSHADEQALFHLVAAGMVERRFGLRLSFRGDEIAYEVTVIATGECGLAEAIQPVAAEASVRWLPKFQELVREGRHHGCFRSIVAEPDDCRLTASGLDARDDLGKSMRGEFGCGEPDPAEIVRAFIFRRGFFGSRPVVGGSGSLVSFRPIPSNGWADPSPGEPAASSAESAAKPPPTLDQIREAFRQEFATAMAGTGRTTAADAEQVDQEVELPPAITSVERTVLSVLHAVGASELLRVQQIIELVSEDVPPGTTAVQNALSKFMELKWIERPEGPRQGARLTARGRKIARTLSAESC
jgi:hypothetical protein